MIRAINNNQPLPTMTEVPQTEEEKARVAERKRRFLSNLSWFEEHALEIGEKHRGRYICVAGGELFVGDDPRELREMARAKYPDDYGAYFSKYIPPHRGPKLYANRWLVAAV